MSQRYVTPREFLPGRENEHLRELGQIVSGLMNGRSNNSYVVTLTADADETSVDVEWARPGGIATFHPMSASAAAAAPSIWTEVQYGKVIVHHDSDASTDRVVGLVLVG